MKCPPRARVHWTRLGCRIPDSHERRGSPSGPDCSFLEDRVYYSACLQAPASPGPEGWSQPAFPAETGPSTPCPTSTLVLSLHPFKFLITVIFIQSGLPTYLRLLKCNSPFCSSPSTASPMKSPGSLCASLFFLLQCPLLSAHSIYHAIPGA